MIRRSFGASPDRRRTYGKSSSGLKLGARSSPAKKGHVRRAARALALILGVCTLSGCRTKPVACKGLREVPEAVTPAQTKKLGAPTPFVDDGVLRKDDNWTGYGSQDRRGRLGPLQVRYRVEDYKGHLITTGVTVDLFDPACPTSRVELRLGETINQLSLWHDVARSRYIVDPADGRLHVFRSAYTPPATRVP
jgi:hypothetical protein